MRPRIALVLSIVLTLAALYMVFMWVPTDREMGVIQRIFYWHVPIAWIAFLAFFITFVSGIAYLAKRRVWWDIVSSASAEIGLLFATLILITGSIWARPVWGVWWTWDARLTSTLVLWLIYVSYLLLRRYSTAGQNPVLAAALAVFGAVDVIFVYMAIRWFRTQHPQPVM